MIWWVEKSVLDYNIAPFTYFQLDITTIVTTLYYIHHNHHHPAEISEEDTEYK